MISDSDKRLREEGLKRNVDFLLSIDKALKNWRALAVWAIAGAVIGAVVAFSTPKTYKVSTLLAPEITTRSTMGGLSSLASLAGITRSSITMTDAMHPNVYPQIVQSPNFYVGMFDMPVTVSTPDSLVHTDLYHYMTSYNKVPWWNHIIALPQKAIDAVKSVVKRDEELENQEGFAVLDPLRLTKEQDGVVQSLAKSVSVAVDKNTYLLSVTVTMQDPVIAAQFANAITDNLQRFVADYRAGKTVEEIENLEKVLKENETAYHSAQSRYARYLDANQGLASKSSQSVQQQLQNELNLNFQMYNQTSQKLLEAKSRLKQETPVIVVVQPAVPPHTGQPSKAKVIIVWMLLGAVLRLAWVIFGVGYMLKNLK